MKMKASKKTKHSAREEMTNNDICSQSVSQQQAYQCYVFYLLVFVFNLRVFLLLIPIPFLLAQFLFYLCRLSCLRTFCFASMIVFCLQTFLPKRRILEKYPKAQRILFHRGQIPTPKKKKDNSLSFIFFLFFFCCYNVITLLYNPLLSDKPDSSSGRLYGNARTNLQALHRRARHSSFSQPLQNQQIASHAR